MMMIIISSFSSGTMEMCPKVTIFTVVEPATLRDGAFTQVTNPGQFLLHIIMRTWHRKEERKRVLMMFKSAWSLRQSSALNMKIELAFGAVKPETTAGFGAGITNELTAVVAFEFMVVSMGRKGEKKRVFGVRVV